MNVKECHQFSDKAIPGRYDFRASMKMLGKSLITTAKFIISAKISRRLGMNSQSKLSTGLAKCTSPGYNIHMSKNPALISMSSRSKWIHLHWMVFWKNFGSWCDMARLGETKFQSWIKNDKKWASLPATVWAGPFLLCSPTCPACHLDMFPSGWRKFKWPETSESKNRFLVWIHR